MALSNAKRQRVWRDPQKAKASTLCGLEEAWAAATEEEIEAFMRAHELIGPAERAELVVGAMRIGGEQMREIISQEMEATIEAEVRRRLSSGRKAPKR